MTLRYAFRSLARSSGFAAVAILTLALGIGATTAMMTIVNSVLFKPLPFPHPERLYTVRMDIQPTNGQAIPASARMNDIPVNAHHFVLWREQCAVCEGVALFGGGGFTLTGVGDAQRLPGWQVSYNFFRTLGVQPELGRDFSASEEGPGGYRVVLLTDELWRSRFAADPAIVGRSVEINGSPSTVVGVIPPALHLPFGKQWGAFFGESDPPALFQPFALDMRAVRTMGNFNYAALVRTRPGASGAVAEAQLSSEVSEFGRSVDVALSARLTPIVDQITGGIRRSLWMLLAGVVALLVLVAINIGGLMLVRSISRLREASIRAALGASSQDLIAPMLAEIGILVACGGALGALIAAAAVRLFVAAAPLGVPRMTELHPDAYTLLFAVVAAAAAGAIAAVGPIRRMAALGVSAALANATRNATDSKRRLRALDLVMTLEIALGTVVLIAGALLVTSFANVLAADRGFDATNVVTQAVALSGPRYAKRESRNAFVDRALDRLGSLPGVAAAAMVSQLPLRGETWVSTLQDAEHIVRDTQYPPPSLANWRFVSSSYFAAMGIPLKQGRDIALSDRTRPVAILSEQAAALLWPGVNPIGRHVLSASTGATGGSVSAEVVGIVADVKTDGLERTPPPIVYEPYWVVGPGAPIFVFRTARDSASLAGDVRDVVQRLDSDVPLQPCQTMNAVVSDVSAVRRYETLLVSAFGIAGLIIASIGLYGLVSFAITRRTREIGLRIALGATSHRIVTTVLGDGLRPVVAGILGGFAGAAAIGDAVADQLYGVSANDPRSFAAVGALLLFVAAGACIIPARRAIRVDPMIPLRAE